MDAIQKALNNCISSSGLAIHGGSSALVKYANTFQFKANGRLSSAITTADCPSLALATLVAPFPSGTASVAGNLKTLYSRIYALIGTLPVTGTSTVNGTGTTLTPTFSWLAGSDFLTATDNANYSNIPLPSQANQAIIGYVLIDNETGSDFVPGTTLLDVGSLNVTYVNNYAEAGE